MKITISREYIALVGSSLTKIMICINFKITITYYDVYTSCPSKIILEKDHGMHQLHRGLVHILF
jgi:hypothetical protein